MANMVTKANRQVKAIIRKGLDKRIWKDREL
jgi:hypothetical protein